MTQPSPLPHFHNISSPQPVRLRYTLRSTNPKGLAFMSLQSLIATGTKVWLDSIDPDFVKTNSALGATGATSNPIIIADLIKTGRFDETITELFEEGGDDTAVAWDLTDHLVHDAQEIFYPVWQKTQGDNGYVSFELDPLLEDVANLPPQAEA